LEEDHDAFARGRMPCGAELWRDSRYILAAWGLLGVKEIGRMGSSPKRNLRSIGPMPPSQIWSSLAFVERVWRTSSLVIVLPVTVLFPIVVTFLFSAVWRHRSALAVYMKCLQVQRQKEVGIVVGR
jgi:hypothetical protein